VFCSGSPALLYAVKLGDESIVRLLLEHGADVNAEMLDIPEDEQSLQQRAEDKQMLHETLHLLRRQLCQLHTPNGNGANAETVDECNNDNYM
jgi:hypothetical protein